MRRSSATVMGSILVLCTWVSAQETTSKITKEMVRAAEPIIRLEFTDAERDSMLENVEELQFTYGADTNDDKALDSSWIEAGAIGTGSVIAVRVRLTARPQQLTAEDQKMMSPRTLESAVTLRNLCMR